MKWLTENPRGRGRARDLWRGLLLGSLLALSSPGAAAVVEEFVSFATGVECCDECASSGLGGSSCPAHCTNCVCCAHPSALPATAQLLPACESERTAEYGFHRVLPCPTGYRSPPFRPPTA